MWIHLVPAREDEEEEEVRDWAMPDEGDEDEQIVEDCMAVLQWPIHCQTAWCA